MRPDTFGRVAVKKLSTQRTSSPRPNSRSHRWEPMNPAPPVTRTRRSLNICLPHYSQGLYNVVALRDSLPWQGAMIISEILRLKRFSLEKPRLSCRGPVATNFRLLWLLPSIGTLPSPQQITSISLVFQPLPQCPRPDLRINTPLAWKGQL